MWNRFTEAARKAIFFSQEEAQQFGEGYVSTEHILLGILRVEDPNVDALLMGCSRAEAIREELLKHLPKGEPKVVENMSLTPRVKRVIDLAYDEARNLNSNVIGNEHLFLGLVREGEGLAGRVLTGFGIQLGPLRIRASQLPESKSSLANKMPTLARPNTSELLAFRQRKWALDRLALVLLADPSVQEFLIARAISPGLLQSWLEELITVPDSRAHLESPPELSTVFEQAQNIAVGQMEPYHLLISIAMEEASWLCYAFGEIKVDPASLLNDSAS